MDVAHELISGRGQDRKRPSLVLRFGTPTLPNARDAHDGFIAKVDFERPLIVAVPLPLKETAYRHDATLTNDEVTIQSALENRFASSIDG